METRELSPRLAPGKLPEKAPEKPRVKTAEELPEELPEDKPGKPQTKPHSKSHSKPRRLMRRRVLHVLLMSDLEQINATRVARQLCVSTSTLRRRLRDEHTNYQKLLDQVRRYRCEKTLAMRWLPGKCLAGKLGFSQPNSFYRAFGRWTGMTYTQYKRLYRLGSVTASTRF